MKELFFGRHRELTILKELLNKRVASLVTLKGRRRIGKTRLTQEFGRKLKSITITGLPPDDEKITAQDQRNHFCKELEREVGIIGIKAEDWSDLLWHLAQATSRGRHLIVLDEINWMGSLDPTFLGKLKTTWDTFFKKNPKLIMILSGSMSAWIEKNILSSTGFLGRVSVDMTLEELPLYQCNHFWQPYEERIAPYEKFKVLCVTGGVPRYLEEINPNETAEENIHRLCFRKEALLFKEFKRIFSDLFSKRADTYQKIVTLLTHGQANYQQICHHLQIEKGGTISDYLEDLEETQYLAREYTWNLKNGTQSKLSQYRLKDNYLRFYLRYIAPNHVAIGKRRFHLPPSWDSIMGLQFENMVINNFHSLYRLLNLTPSDIVQDGPYFQTHTKEHLGCQIDFLIQTRYHTLYLCEIKFSNQPIGTEVISEIQEKIERLHTPGITFSYRPILIHVNGVTEALKQSQFFTHIIDFGDLLKE